jgi:hypothetical protein
VQFGVAEEVNSTTGYAIGLMGVGYSENEATQHQYPNMPEVLRDTRVINSRLYSVYLNDVDDTGSILFGGLDTSKIKGELATLNLLPDAQTSQIDQFITTVTATTVKTSGKTTTLFSGGTNDVSAYQSSTNPALPVLLDTGSSAWSVDQDVYNKLFAPLFTYVDAQGLCSCAEMSNGDEVTLEFGAKINITIPSREFITPVYNTTTNEPVVYNSKGEQACAFMIVGAQSTGEGFQTLGDAILRSMYVVFDLDNGQVSIAQANVNSTASPSIVTVSAGASGVASAVSSSYTGAPSNTWSIAAEVTSGTASFSVSTAGSTIGTATGTAAIPVNAQAEQTGSSGSSSGGSSASSSKGVAAGITVPSFEWSNLWVMGWSVVAVAVGMGLAL